MPSQPSSSPAGEPDAPRPPSGRRSAVSLLATAIGLAAVVWVGITFDWRAVWPVLRNADLSALVGGTLAGVTGFWAARTIRWRLLLGRPDLPLGSLFAMTAVASGLANLTPGQLGEAVKVETLARRHEVPRPVGLRVMAIERIVDLYTLWGLGLLTLAMSDHIMDSRVADAFMALLSGASVIGLVALYAVRWPGRLERIQQMLRLRSDELPALLTAVPLSALAWLCTAGAWWACLRSVGLPIGMVDTVALMATVVMAGIVSLVPGGLGVAEAVTATTLQAAGHAEPLAQAGALAIRAVVPLALAMALPFLPLVRGSTPSTD